MPAPCGRAEYAGVNAFKGAFYLQLRDGSGVLSYARRAPLAAPDAPERQALLMITLGLIFCSAGRELDEPELYRRLHALDPNVEGAPPRRGVGGGEIAGVGRVADLVEAFRKQHYIVAEPREDADGAPTCALKIGPRAFVEFGRKQIVHFIADSLGQVADPTVLNEIRQELAREAEAAEKDEAEAAEKAAEKEGARAEAAAAKDAAKAAKAEKAAPAKGKGKKAAKAAASQ